MTMMRTLRAVATLVLGLGALGCGGSEQVVTYESGLRIELRGNRIYINQTIEFEHDSDVLLPSAAPILDALAEVLGNHPEIYRVQIQGHSSTDGDEQHNLELSGARAAAVAEYLRGHGVTAEITSQGYGETYPLCHEESDECHARNRRVEFFTDSR